MAFRFIESDVSELRNWSTTMKTKTRKEVQKESSIQTAKQALVNNGRKQNKNEQLESLKVLQIKKKANGENKDLN